MTEDPPGGRTTRRAVLASVPVGLLAGGIAGVGTSVLTDAGRDTSNGRPTAVPSPVPAGDESLRLVATDLGVVGDGLTENSAALNALLSDARVGTEIVLPPGEYVVASRLRIASGVTLRGAGRGATTVRLADGAGAPFVLISGATDIHIAGIHFDGGEQSGDQIGIQVDGCSDVVIERCAFTRTAHSVHAYSSTETPCERITVQDNLFTDSRDFAIRISEQVRNARIMGNTIESVIKAAEASPSGITVRGTDITVSGNTVLASDDTGIMVSGETTARVSVTDNVLTTTLVTIFHGSGAVNGTITGNRITSLRDFGIHLFDRGGSSSSSIVARNQILASGKSGVQIEGVSDIVVAENVISDPATRSGIKASWRCGIVLTATEGGPSSRIVLSANVIRSVRDDSRMEHGVLLEEVGADMRITGTVISGAEGAPVRVESGLEAPYYVETTKSILTSLVTRRASS